MCCRFYIRKNDPELAPAMEAAAKSPLLARIQKIHPTPLVCEGEVCPTNLVAAFATTSATTTLAASPSATSPRTGICSLRSSR